MDRTLQIQATKQDEGLTRIELKNGMWLTVTMIDLGEGRPDQLCVTVNTEGMDPDDCHDNGIPLMEVMLNDAIIYDREPDTKLPKNFDPDNMIGNVLTTIRDRTGQDLEEVVRVFSEEAGEGDYEIGEANFWDSFGGPFVDEIQNWVGL